MFSHVNTNGDMLNTEFTQVMQLCTLNLCGIYFLHSAFFPFHLGCNYPCTLDLFVTIAATVRWIVNIALPVSSWGGSQPKEKRTMEDQAWILKRCYKKQTVCKIIMPVDYNHPNLSDRKFGNRISSPWCHIHGSTLLLLSSLLLTGICKQLPSEYWCQ